MKSIKEDKQPYSKDPRNGQYRPHGFWLIYDQDRLHLRVNYVLGFESGYEEWHTRRWSTYYIQ